jgi:hypothetical protein
MICHLPQPRNRQIANQQHYYFQRLYQHYHYQHLMHFTKALLLALTYDRPGAYSNIYPLREVPRAFQPSPSKADSPLYS